MSSKGPPYMGLWRERSAAAENIQQMLVTVEFAESTVPVLDVQLEILNGYWGRFQEAQRSLLVDVAHIDEISCTINEVERDMQRMYTAAKLKLLHERSKLTIQQTKPKAPRVSDIKIPTFSGKYTEWAAWRSQFKAKVLDANIDVADKITLLTTALIKEAATCAT